jgi:hypothetical protein
MGHRIREAMREGALAPMGSGGGIVEVDETFIGREEGKPKKRAFFHKQKVLSLVDRENREARSMVIDNVTSAEIFPILEKNIAREARIMTDDGTQYTALKIFFRRHETVKHRQGEYVSPLNRALHTNTVEGYFSIFKRGMKGIYQHCKKQHLHRYLPNPTSSNTPSILSERSPGSSVPGRPYFIRVFDLMSIPSASFSSSLPSI